MFVRESNLSDEQLEAVELCTGSSALVGVTGEAGSGKTSTLKIIVDHIEEEQDGGIALIAPTGRAAKRISEATGKFATTIHRFLRWSVPSDDDDYGLPAYDKFNKYPHRYVFVDESSMVNEELYRALIDACPSGGRIRFFGDANQLPPVEGVSPFLRLLDKFPNVRLTKNFRSQDGVVSAARQIIQGRIPEPNDKFNMLNPGRNDLLPVIDGFIDDSFRGTGSQMIIPTKVGKFGCHALNAHMQHRLNPGSNADTLRYSWKDTKSGEEQFRKFRRGDKVIQTKNDYKLNVFNGEIGHIEEVDTDAGDIVIDFGDKIKRIPTHLESYNPEGRAIFQYDPRRNIELAYAVTTHKAQGSEFDKVVLVLNKSFVLNRANFYTAVTRAKNSVQVILGHGALSAAMRKNSPEWRK